MSLADDIEELLGGATNEDSSVAEASKLARDLEALTERQSGGKAFSDIAKMWRKNATKLLSIATNLRINVGAIKRTPGYEGRGRPGLAEMDQGAKALIEAIGSINKGLDKMQLTTFLEEKGEPGPIEEGEPSW